MPPFVFLYRTQSILIQRRQTSPAVTALVTNTLNTEQLTVLKVEFVKVHALHQISESLRFKRSQSGVTDSPVTGQQHLRLIILDFFQGIIYTHIKNTDF